MKKTSLFFDSSLIYFVVIAGFVLLRITTNLIDVGVVGGAICSIIIQLVLMLLVPFFMYKFMRKKKATEVLTDFNVKKIGLKAVFFAICLGIVVYFLNLAVASFFSVIINATGYDPSFGMSSASGGEYSVMAFISDLILSAMLPGICEEFCHRGMLLNGYKTLGAKKAIILIGLLFGLMHLNIEQFFYASIIGMFLTFLVYVTGSIIPSMIVHFLNNALGLYFSFASVNKLPFGNFSEVLASVFDGNPITTFGTIILIVIILLALLAFFTFMLLKSTRVKMFKSLAQKAIENKQREELLKSFDIDVETTNKEQGISMGDGEPVVVIGDEIVKDGKRGMVIDLNFGENDLMSNVIKKPSLKDKAFLYGTIFIGVFITISTLIWGIL